MNFCTRECKDKAQTIEGGIKELWPKHYSTARSSYRKRALKLLGHACQRCGWHIDKRILQVHHKNRDILNNHISNLEVLCMNCHALEHI